MTLLDHDPAPTPSSRADKALRWITALTLLATVAAAMVLVFTGNAGYVGTVLGIGAAAAAIGGTVHICIHVRR
ncbi:hypothetical protein ACFYZN_38200 [Streptomyces sp. NPDC001777]|uniref:hypothetical protein n=1 Tax=Streptomyces sp. NPDC001777 TaxID=3364608 RepID=UPI003679CFFD